MEIDLNNVEETLLIPLRGRAQISKDFPSLLNDAKAIELVEHIDYDFSTLDKAFRFEGILQFAARAKQFDDKLKAYITAHPYASVVNIGAGLDTTFSRIDNGTINWYDLDLPNVIELRKQLIPETNRATCIAKSLFDSSWCTDVRNTKDGVFIVAGGVLIYFEEAQVKQFFSLLADNLHGGEIVFNVQSKLGNLISNWGLRRTGMKRATSKWALKEANKMTKWDKRIEVIDQFPLFKNIPRDPAWGKEIKRWMDFIDKNRVFNIFHLRV
jgi:O-methyltransferase involved in polyketide biosynthesis